MRRIVKIAIVIAAATVAAVGQSAYTDSIGSVGATKVIGFAQTTISGATATSVNYTYSTDNSQIDSITVALSGDTTSSQLYVGYNTNAPVTCGAGSYSSPDTTYVCSSLAWTISGITTINFVLR